MSYHHRHVESRFLRLSQRFPVTVVGGARQSGKSTLLNELLAGKANFTVFDPVTDVGNARGDPELFLRLNPPPSVLDEVQYAPQLLPVIKRLVDDHPGAKGQYFLTGSQQFQVLSQIQESLAGRALVFDLWPMSRGELAGDLKGGLIPALYADPPPADARTLVHRLHEIGPPSTPRGNLYERIFRGGYPGLLGFSTADIPAWHDSYLRTYVERDVRLLRTLDQPHDFTRFLRLMAALTAQEVNASQLGREIGVTPKTSRAWLDTLAASFQVVILDAYSGNTVKRVSGRPKAFLSDTGFACHLLSISSPRTLSILPILGHLFETFVVNEVIRSAQELDLRPRCWHWRTAGGAKVDLLLERDGVFCPIEIKLTSRPSRQDIRGLGSFADTYPGLALGPRIIVHGGADLCLVDEVTAAVPVDWV